MKKKNPLYVIIFLMTIIIFYYLLASLNASFKDYVVFTLSLIFLVGAIGNIFKDYHSKNKPKDKNQGFKINLN